VEDRRAQVLAERVRGWNEADAIRDYCDAIEAAYGEEAIAADPDALAWLTYARERADRLQVMPRMPADPEATPEALRLYLGRWDPYRPRGW
jgi:hypothetical protein